MSEEFTGFLCSFFSLLHCCISQRVGVRFYDDISALYHMEDGISSL